MVDMNGASWVKSSYSGEEGDCVELATLHDNGMAIRDSKRSDGPVVRISTSAWTAFRSSLKSGELSA
ncbi:DUF397 domain-containing protein [Sphaerisporangium album]|uniref:DUF397 domain-containing protein n=1 Tax=Sphaerisporangium album TaxID=509200 RepID=A0A367FDZ8_9ACTN|nr:DUF397 domain-containing protein [Sphaerisporangium album]RCG27915.1 DUF397 domain-containing protein [Sphaerisporangium album]